MFFNGWYLSAIKSYFSVHDVEINIKFNGRKRDQFNIEGEAELTISEFYKMLTYSKADHTPRAVVMVKFQSDLDSSTRQNRKKCIRPNI